MSRKHFFLPLALALLPQCVWPEPSTPLSDPPDPPPAPSPGETPPAGPCLGDPSFSVGAGVYDITGPAAEIGMMGYAQVGQRTAGIHMRLRSRAFVIASPCNGKRVAFVSADLGMLFQGVQQGVVERLRRAYGPMYSDENVVLSATHTHSGPGGFSHHALYNLTTLGYDRQGYDVIVEGIYQSIRRAHDAMVPDGSIRIAAGDLGGVGRNRSPEAYRRNPAGERAAYAGDTDTTMTVLRLDADGRDEGAISWFALHGTSLGNKNHLISGDNKGYASYLFERSMGTDYSAPRTFVAAFAQSNEGDVSPNIYGGKDGRGPDALKSLQATAFAQYARARSLYEGADEVLTGGVDYRHTYIKMDEIAISSHYTDGEVRRTCTAGIGLSMLAGTQDGPGFGWQGIRCGSIALLGGAIGLDLCGPPADRCQAEKPVVLATGAMRPYPWTPDVLPIHIVTIGGLAILALPFEATTMSGRRLRAAMLAQLQPMGVTHAVIAGLSNAYAGYLTTREEYAAQRYEGASNHFGPWTLAALTQEVDQMAYAMRTGAPVPPGPTPRDLRNAQRTLITPVLFDSAPLGKELGDVIQRPASSYAPGQAATVSFWGGHPRNNLRTQGTFLEIQKRDGSAWTTVARDWDWETAYLWQRSDCPACSRVTIQWAIPRDAIRGTYRIVHHGDAKRLTGAIRPYSGVSPAFEVR